MKRIGTGTSLLLTGLLVFTLFPQFAAAQTEVQVTCSWQAPAYGTPVDYYVLEHSVNEGPWEFVANVDATSYSMPVTAAGGHRIRVAGVDAGGNQGPYSLPSLTYTSGEPAEGEPGQPGQPVRM